MTKKGRAENASVALRHLRAAVFQLQAGMDPLVTLPTSAEVDPRRSIALTGPVKFGAIIFLALSLFARVSFSAALPEARLLPNVKPLPVAIDHDFQFRKTKLYLMTEQAPSSGTKEKVGKGGPVDKSSSNTKSTSVVQEASITFERQYRLFGAVTKLDQHQRFGNYFDFFWRTRRPADLTVRLEYRQEKLHEHVQAQEVSYGTVRGSHKSSFKVVGDDYSDGGRVIAWRCLLIEQGKIVAENRSYLWR